MSIPAGLPGAAIPYWTLPAGIDLDTRVAREVLGLTVVENPVNYRGYEVQWDDADYHIQRSDVQFYSSRMGDAWAIVEEMAHRMGYEHLGYLWRGPLFKPEHHYLTNEGYPLGTTCWYVIVETGHLNIFFYAETAPLVICRAALFAVAQGIT